MRPIAIFLVSGVAAATAEKCTINGQHDDTFNVGLSEWTSEEASQDLADVDHDAGTELSQAAYMDAPPLSV
jgi:hypothetical protein